MDYKYLVALNCYPKIGSQTLKKILSLCDDPKLLWQESESVLRAKLGDKLSSYVIEARAKYDPDAEIERLARYDVGYLTCFDSEYPGLLKQVYDCPAILYIKGDIEVLKSRMIGVVGSRKYSNYGKNFSYKLSGECAKAGLTIVSGLALGIDAFAHQAALDYGGKTVGVLGCGLDSIYPVSNYHLAKEIIETGGAIISEFPIGVGPMKQNFPARNRIIAGMSLGLLVIEAAIKSGALITAYQALEYNREVFALPGNIDSENSVGTNKLIQAGAKLVLSSEDIFEELNIEKKIATETAKSIFPESQDEQIIIEILRQADKSINDVVRESSLNVIAVNSALTILEMKGTVQNLGGGCYHFVNN